MRFGLELEVYRNSFGYLQIHELKMKRGIQGGEYNS
jgi:hypothetical protein